MHFAVAAHREIISVALDAFACEQIMTRVTDEACWRAALTDYRLHTHWSLTNLSAQLDRYARWDEIKAQAAPVVNAVSSASGSGKNQTPVADSWLRAARMAGFDVDAILAEESHANGN